MSKKNIKLLTRIIGVLVCVALLAITVIPVNTVYAEDGDTTANTDQTQETTGTTADPSESQDASSDTDSQEGQDDAGSVPANTAKGSPAKSPTRAGVSITASIVDHNGDTIDFSSGTSGTEAAMRIRQYAELTQHEYPVTISINGFSSDSTNKKLEFIIPDGIALINDGRTDQLEDDLDLTKGDRGIEKENRSVFVWNQGGGGRPTLGSTVRKVTYYINDANTACGHFDNIKVALDQVYFYSPSGPVKDPIIIKVYENDVLVAETKLDEIKILNPINTIPKRNDSVYEYSEGYTEEIKKKHVLSNYIHYTSAHIINSYKATYTISDPSIKFNRITYYGNNNDDFAGGVYLSDKSRENEGIYVISSNPEKSPYNGAAHTQSVDSYNYYSLNIPDTYKAGDSFTVTVDWELDMFDVTSDGNSVKYSGSFTDTFKIVEEKENLSITFSPGAALKNPKNAQTQFGYFSVKNQGSVSYPEGVFDITFNDDCIGVQAMYVNFLNGESTAPGNNYGEHTFEITTNKRQYTKTIDVKRAGVSSAYGLTSYGHVYIDSVDFGLEEGEYITNIKFDVHALKANYSEALYFYGYNVNQSNEIKTSIKYYTIDPETNQVDRMLFEDSFSGTRGKATLTSSIGGIYRVSDDVLSPNISAGESVELRFTNFNASNFMDPYMYLVISTKDGAGNYLKAKDFKFGSANRAGGLNSLIAVPDSAIYGYESPENDCYVYRIDTSVIGQEYGFENSFTLPLYGRLLANYQSQTLRFTLVVPYGTPAQSQKLSETIYVQDGYVTVGEGYGLSYIGGTNTALYNSAPEGLLKRDNDNNKYIDVTRRGDLVAFSIVPFKTIDVASSAKNHSSNDYIVWNEGDEPIAVGNKSTFDIKVDVVNSTEAAVDGETVIYIPVPKAGQDWGKLMEDDEGNKYSIDFSTKLNSVTPMENFPIGVDYKIEYGNITPADNNTDLEAQDSRFSTTLPADTSQINCVKITLGAIPANAAGTPDLYSFVLNCSTDNVTEEGDINTYRPLFKRNLGGSVSWPRGSMLSLETALGEVRGQLFFDENYDGKFEGEAGLSIANTELVLHDAAGNEIAKTKTDASGKYLFVDIKTKDEYSIQVSKAPTNYTYSPAGRANKKGIYYTDNQFNSNGKSTTVYPAMADSSGVTSAVYNVGLREADLTRKVTFKLNGGKTSAGSTNDIVIEDLVGKAVTKPENPVRDGYKFKYWYETNENTAATIVTEIGYEDKTYTAKWELETYNITYVLGGGTNDPSNPKTYTYETTDITLKAATKKGYKFDGWVDAGNNKVTKISKGSSGDLTLTATWTKETYNITYDYAGGTDAGNRTTYDVDTADFKLTNPTRKGYTFTGWTGTGLTAATKDVTVKQGTTGALSFKANWSMDTYEITYNLDGGTNDPSNPATYTYETADITLKAATKKGYTFTGWTPEGSIPKNSTGDKNFKAGFRANTYTITFNGDGADSGSMDDIPAEYDKAVKAPENGFYREGHDFEGWVDDKGKVYQPGDDLKNLTDVDGAKVTLKPKWVSFSYSCESGEYQVWTKGSSKNADFVFKRSRKDELTFGNFVEVGEVVIDGKPVDPSAYVAEAGSLKLGLTPAYLRGLSAGKHNMTVYFMDGSVTVEFTVRVINSDGPVVSYQIPNTGIE